MPQFITWTCLHDSLERTLVCLPDHTGKLLKFQITGGHAADCAQAKSLLKGQKAKAFVADKGYDTNTIIRFIKRCMKGEICNPSKMQP